MQKSEIFNMNLFESGDPVKAEFFNENTAILEAALQYRPKMVMGAYLPVEHDNNGNITKTLTFDAPPLLVGIANESAMMFALRGSTGTFTAFRDVDSGYRVAASWDGNSVTFTGSSSHMLFGSSTPAIYFAFLGEAEAGGEK